MENQPSQRVTIEYQLEIISGNKIIIPGCEPTSSLTSAALSYNLAEFGCNNALLDVDAALAAIPGSYIKLGNNYNKGNTRQKWFVLPPVGVDCPCAGYEDYYNKLKNIADNSEQVDETIDYCNMNNMGYCPSPEFDSVSAPKEDKYYSEGSSAADAGVLPPVPPWGLSGTN